MQRSFAKWRTIKWLNGLLLLIQQVKKRTDLLVEHVGRLREAVAVTKAERPFRIDAWVVLPDHLHCVWTLPGGDFATTSGIATIGVTDNTVYTFSSQPGMVADVQNWVNTSSSNFGWILKAENETVNRDARVFGSRESAIGQQPTLTVNFTAVPEPNSLNLFAAIGVATWAFRASRRRSPLASVSY